MISIFIDETSDKKFKDYFGLCCATINSSFYPEIKRKFQDILLNFGWDTSLEFKGSFLFSASQGDVSVPVEERVEIAKEILSLNKSTTNARIKFHYFAAKSANQREDYLRFLPIVLKKSLPSAKKKGDKDLVTIHCDHRSDIGCTEIRKVLYPVLEERGFALFEDIHMPTSRFETVGILYADIVGYLQSRVHTISSDAELFENIAPAHWETNGKLRKLKSSTELLEGIKALNLYTISG